MSLKSFCSLFFNKKINTKNVFLLNLDNLIEEMETMIKKGYNNELYNNKSISNNKSNKSISNKILKEKTNITNNKSNNKSITNNNKSNITNINITNVTNVTNINITNVTNIINLYFTFSFFINSYNKIISIKISYFKKKINSYDKPLKVKKNIKHKLRFTEESTSVNEMFELNLDSSPNLDKDENTVEFIEDVKYKIKEKIDKENIIKEIKYNNNSTYNEYNTYNNSSTFINSTYNNNSTYINSTYNNNSSTYINTFINNSINNYIINTINSIVKTYKRYKYNNSTLLVNEIFDNTSLSVSSKNISLENSLFICVLKPNKELMKKANDFYLLLERANKGEIKIKQEKCYGVISIKKIINK